MELNAQSHFQLKKRSKELTGDGVCHLEKMDA
jgi:hypothetical protein